MGNSKAYLGLALTLRIEHASILLSKEVSVNLDRALGYNNYDPNTP